MAADLQFGCVLFVTGKQRVLIKVQRERSGRVKIERKVTTNFQTVNMMAAQETPFIEKLKHSVCSIITAAHPGLGKINKINFI